MTAPSNGNPVFLADAPTISTASTPRLLATAGVPSSVSDDTASDAKLSTVSVERHDTRSLWLLAYQKLETDSKHEKLLAEFNDKVLKGKVDGESNTRITLSSASKADLIQLIDKQLENFEASTARTRTDKVLARIVKTTLFAKDFIDQAAAISPHVAMAWAGVSLLLPLLSNPRTETLARKEGIDYVAQVIRKFTLVEKVYASSLEEGTSFLEGNTAFHDTVVELYAGILLFQISTICVLTSHLKSQVLRDTVRLDNLDSLLASVKDTEALCEAYFIPLNQAELQSQLEQLIQDTEKHASTHGGLLSGIKDHLAGSRREQHQKELTAQEQACRHALFSNYESQKNQNPKRVAGTCRWALEHANYLEWRINSDRQLLWISAHAGCGKSVLSRAIIDEDLPVFYGKEVLVLYYFFKDTNAEQRSASKGLAAILHQLFETRPDCIPYAMPVYQSQGAKMTGSLHGLWRTLIEICQRPNMERIVCIFDALDECNSEDCKELIHLIGEVYRNTQQPSQLKFLLTGRPYLDLKAEIYGIDDNELIELDGAAESACIKEEIDRVIEHTVLELARKTRMPPNVEAHFRRRLLGMEQRTYLWLRLIWEILPKVWPGSITMINKILDTLPVNINSAYQTLLLRCPDPAYAMKVLQMVLVAFEPLSLSQVDTAMHVDSRCKSMADIELEGTAALRETLSGRCGLMITVVDERLYFLHQTVKEFLLQISAESIADLEHDNLTIERSHCLLAVACVQMLAFPEIKARISLNDPKSMLKWPNVSGVGGDFLTYAISFWANHFEEGRCAINLDTLALPNTVMIFTYPSTFHVFFHPLRPTPAICAASANLRLYILKHLVSNGADKEEVFKFQTILGMASQYGQLHIVQYLLDLSVRINSESQSACYSPLERAARYGHKAIAEELVQRGANVNSQVFGPILLQVHRHTYIPLESAVEAGHIDIVELLLANGAHVNHVSARGSALHVAAKFNRGEICRLLIRAGADVNNFARFSLQGTALEKSVSSKSHDAMSLLLQNGADTAVLSNSACGTALVTAVRACSEFAVRNILKHGADVNLQGGLWAYALQAASFDELIRQETTERRTVRRNIVSLLLTEGAEVNAVGGIYGSALNAALRNKKDDLVLLLRQHGARETLWTLADREAYLKAHDMKSIFDETYFSYTSDEDEHLEDHGASSDGELW